MTCWARLTWQVPDVAPFLEGLAARLGTPLVRSGSAVPVAPLAAGGIVVALGIGWFVTHTGKKWLENRL